VKPTFADPELALQGVKLDPTLQAICDFLDQNPEVLERVQANGLFGNTSRGALQTREELIHGRICHGWKLYRSRQSRHQGPYQITGSGCSQ
jgi:hypothetical protein